MSSISKLFGMKSTNLLALFIASFSSIVMSAQNDIQGIVVEKYYVSDANDATDTDGGILQEGHVTYRIFIDLIEGSKLRSIYGNENHPLYITSTDLIWNNEDRGKTFGFEIDDNRLDENTVALDSWFSFGLSSNMHYGIEKALDPDTSVVGGANNDGGSESISGGLLVNQDPLAGIPLTNKDGLVNIDNLVVPALFVTGNHPQTIFDDATIDTSFYSTDTNMFFGEGIMGPNADNKIIVAQITTKGELTFELNIEVINPLGQIIKYVADDEILLTGEFGSPYLKYPPSCGCTDPAFLEYNPLAGCDDGSCQTVVVIGCSDPLACNYDPGVNLNVPELCCILPDNCEGLDPELICENLDVLNASDLFAFNVYPNPFSDQFTLDMSTFSNETSILEIFNSTGQLVLLENNLSTGIHDIDMNHMERGLYLIRLMSNHRVISKTIVKQ